MNGRLLLWSAGLASAAAIVAGIAVLDSPAEMRRRAFDAQRVRELREIAELCDAHWAREQRVPADLESLARSEGARLKLRDPVSGEPYAYRATGDQTYELCAHFSSATPDDADYFERTGWRHPAGDHCYARTAEKPPRD